MKWIASLGLIALVALAFSFWFFNKPGEQQLNFVNNLVPGDGDVELILDHHTFDAETGLALNIWAPSTRTPEKKYPVVVFMYGGGWRAGGKDAYAFLGRALAHRGFIVVLPDYRLFPKTKFPGFMEDTAKAVAWTHDNIADHGGDIDRIFLSGQSAGAYNAVMVALDPQWLGRLGKEPDLIRGVAAMAGPYDFYPFDSQTTKQSFGDYPDPEMTQPINFARGDAPPLWLSSGVDDTQVLPRNSIKLVEKVSALGGKAEYKEYADVDHLDIIMAISKPFRGKGPVLDDMIQFMQSQ